MTTPKKTRKKTATKRALTFASYVARLRSVYEREGVELALKKGAAEKQLATLRRTLGFAISAGLSNVWRTANGSESPVFARPGFFTGYELLSIGDAIAARKSMAKRAASYDDHEQEKRDPRIRAGWYCDGWLPFAAFGGGTLVLIEDQSPAERGAKGQIIGYVHDPDQIVYVADSMPALLAASIEAIEANPYEFGISADQL